MLLRARNLRKSYRKRRVVDDVSFDVGSREIVALLGPNGAGKTTTFYMSVGLTAPEAGTIEFDQRDITNAPMYERGRLGMAYLPQEPSVFRRLSVEQNILAILELRPELDRHGRRESLEQLIGEFSLDQVRTSPGYVLSGGERRRVEIARALAQNPRLILLDEPFAGIDPIAVDEIKTIVGQLCQRGVAVLITDHNVRETLSICHRAYILSEGRLLEEGTPAQIAASQTVRRFYLGESHAPEHWT